MTAAHEVCDITGDRLSRATLYHTEEKCKSKQEDPAQISQLSTWCVEVEPTLWDWPDPLDSWAVRESGNGRPQEENSTTNTN